MAVDDRRITQTIASEIGARPDQISAAAATTITAGTVDRIPRFSTLESADGALIVRDRRYARDRPQTVRGPLAALRTAA